jgi:glycyl-tRNA synthetase beta chain
MAELLLELLSEEMPAGVQKAVAENLERLIAKGLKEAGLSFESIDTFVTPRRLGLVVDGLPEKQPDVHSEKRGPRVGALEKAVAGFCQSLGLTRDQLEEREADKGRFYFAVIEAKGRPTAAVLAEVLPSAMTALPWPKSMRWGTRSLRWVRPVHGLLCLFDGHVLQFTFADTTAGNTTVGHRVHAPVPFAVTDFADYERKLHDACVLVDPAQRRTIILKDAGRLAGEAGSRLRQDEGLLSELAGLVEWPVVLMGAIDADYMSLPEEVLIAAMRNHQRYLATEAPDGKLAARFIVVANIEADDGGSAIVAGNERVLRARLADARFFWDQDREISLSDRVPRLAEVIFHAKLGTLDQKVDRIEALAMHLAQHIPATAHDRVRMAARLCKADLLTEMVGEFPELQGTMGRHYALAEGEDTAVADAIAEHYAPLGPSDTCPSAPESVAVALADKIDTLVGFFAIDEKPTGSRDPFALRRAALGVIRLIVENGLRIPLNDVFVAAVSLYPDEEIEEGDTDSFGLLTFFADRLKVHLRERGVRHDLISAVFALTGEDDLVRLLARVEALGAFLESDDGANLLTAFKRANNIVEIEQHKDGKTYGGGDLAESLLVASEEMRLQEALARAEADVGPAIKKEDFTGACHAFAKLRVPIDAFFDQVTVNTDDAASRENRLRLLDVIRTRFLLLADFSLIEG